MKNAFYFTLKTLLVMEIFKFLSTFWSCRKNGLIRKIYLLFSIKKHDISNYTNSFALMGNSKSIYELYYYYMPQQFFQNTKKSCNIIISFMYQQWEMKKVQPLLLFFTGDSCWLCLCMLVWNKFSYNEGHSTAHLTFKTCVEGRKDHFFSLFLNTNTHSERGRNAYQIHCSWL